MKLKTKINSILIFSVALTGIIGCGPVKLENVVEVGPNETAFLVNLEQDNQGKFESIQYLETKKVAAKRILLPQRKQSTGRMPFSYQWIPTARVIKVDRSLVSRKWTGEKVKDSQSKALLGDPAIDPLEVESLDSIGFAVGVTITARVDESDAAKFLYYHSGKQLSEVIDTNIKSFILARLSTLFGTYPLSDCRLKKNEIFAKVQKEAQEFFKEKGITIEYMGLSEGLTYLNPEIQSTIDNSFKAQQDKITAQQEQEAQTIRNKTLVSQRQAEAEAANMLARNLSAVVAKQQLEIEIMKAKALATMAERWNGQLPSNVIPSDNPLMGMFFGAAKK